LQKRSSEAGSVTRVPAHEIETAVVNALREHLDKSSAGGNESAVTERELIEQQVERIVIQLQSLEIHLVSRSGLERGEPENEALESQNAASPTISVPWAAAPIGGAKGIVHSPSSEPAMSQQNRDRLLTAIAKARAWIEDLAEGRAASFEEIAEREGKAERHIRSLLPLAFASPRIISAIADGSMPISGIIDLAKASVFDWREQERQIAAPKR